MLFLKLISKRGGDAKWISGRWMNINNGVKRWEVTTFVCTCWTKTETMKESNQIKSFVEPVGMNGSNIILKMRCFLCLLWLSLPPEMGDTFSLFFRFHSFSAFVSVPLLTPLNVAILIKLHCSFVSFLSPDFYSYLHRKNRRNV